MKRAPTPLLESGELTVLERRVLEAGNTVAPVDYDVAAGGARLRAALELGANAPGSPDQAAAAHSTTTIAGHVPVIKLVCGLIAAAGLGVAGNRAVQPRVARHAPVVLSAAAKRATAIDAMPPSAASESPAHAAAPPPPASARTDANGARDEPNAPRIPSDRSLDAPSNHGNRARRHRRAALVVPGSMPGASLTRPAPIKAAQAEPLPAAAPIDVRPRPAPNAALEELHAVARARTLAARDPHAALTVLERLARSHPHGYLLEERAALGVLALWNAGQRDLARQRASRFLHRYPRSPFADQMHATMRR